MFPAGKYYVGDLCYVMHDEWDEVCGLFFKGRDDHGCNQGMFELKYLVLFTKCTNLCASTQIHLKNDYPLVLRYMVANLGEVRLVLAPKKQKTETSGRPQKV